MNLDAVAVKLDLVNPARAARDLVDRGCQGWLNESGEGFLNARSLLRRATNSPLHATHGFKPAKPNRSERRNHHCWSCIAPWQEEEPMAKASKKTARGRKQDRARVAGEQDYEVRY